tara:strand:+ start:153 stop:1181 length:1029 start_codon:yes stop_codon:yes gene_type:complete
MNYILGVLAILFAVGLFSLNPVLLKSNNASFIYKALFSTITVVIPSFIYILMNNKKNNEIDNEIDNIEEIKILLLNKNTYISSIAYFFYTVVFFYCQQTLPMSISLPVFMLYPFILLLLNRVINKDSINIGEVTGGIITFIGIIILSKSPLKVKPPNYMFKILLCLVAAFCCASAYLFLKTSEDRVIVKEESDKIVQLKKEKDMTYNIHANMLLLNGIPALIFILIILIKNTIFRHKYNNTMLFKGDNNFKSIGQLLLYSFILQYGCNLLQQYGFINLDTVTYSALVNASVVFAFIYGKIFFKETINLQKIVGIIVIISGISFDIYSSTRIKDHKGFLFIKR